MNEQEKVLVFPTRMLDGFKFQGVLTKRPMMDLIDKILWNNHELSFLERSKAEIDPGFKQIIPYCIFKNTKNQIFSYERTTKSGENRLHGFRSAGVGGHISEIDGLTVANDRAYVNCVTREIKEETGLDTQDYTSTIIGAINDDSNSVGLVHFGVAIEILLFDGSQEKMKLEGALANGSWNEISWLKQNVGVFESWSSLVINGLLKNV